MSGVAPSPILTDIVALQKAGYLPKFRVIASGDLAAAGIPRGTLLADPATGDIYGQSDGAGGFAPVGELPDGGLVSSVAGKTGAVLLDPADVNLGEVDNTSDEDKPISDAQQAAFDAVAATLSAKQPLDDDLTAIAGLVTQAFGRSLLTAADAAAARTLLALAAGATAAKASQAEAEAGSEDTKFMTALKVAQAIAALAPGGGGSGGTLIGSGPNDITALTVVASGPAAGKIETYNDGVPHTITYDGSGLPTEDVIIPEVKRTIAAVAGTPYFRVSGSNRYRGGAYSLTLAERNELMADVAAATLSIDPGWKIWVQNVGSIVMPAGGAALVPGALATFNGEFFAWDHGVMYRNLDDVSHGPSGSESGVLRSLLIPATVPNIRSSILVGADIHWGNAATVGTKTVRIKFQGTTGQFYTATGIATTHEWHHARKSMRFMGALNVQRCGPNHITDASSGSTSSADIQEFSVNAATTDLFFDLTLQHTDATTDVGTLKDFWSIVTDHSFLFA